MSGSRVVVADPSLIRDPLIVTLIVTPPRKTHFYTVNAEPKEDFGGGHPDPNLTYAHELVDIMVILRVCAYS